MAERMALGYGAYGSRSEEERRVREDRNNLEDRMKATEKNLDEVSSQAEIKDLVVPNSSASL